MTTRFTVAVLGLAVAASACADDGPGPTATTTTTALSGVAIDALEPGSCLSTLPDGAAGRVEPVDCARAHRAEVYAVHDLDDGPFPGAGALTEHAAQGCAPLYQGYAGEPIDPTTDLAFAELVPSPESWEGGDRRVVCLAVPPGGATAEGTIAAVATAPEATPA